MCIYLLFKGFWPCKSLHSSLKIHSVLHGISSTLKYWLHPSKKKILNLSDPILPLLWATPPLKILENITPPPLPPWNVPSSKKEDSFLKETKDFISSIKSEHIWTLKYEYTVPKFKNQSRVRCLLSILFLLGS